MTAAANHLVPEQGRFRRALAAVFEMTPERLAVRLDELGVRVGVTVE